MSNTLINEESAYYIHLHSDCIPVKGALRSCIYDLTRREIISFQSEYFDLLIQLSQNTIGIILKALTSPKEKNLIINFIHFLLNEELVIVVKDASMFPLIESKWEIPGIIQNSIIDVNEKVHDFKKIFSQLDILGCQFIQIRCFSNLLSLKDLGEILQMSMHKSIRSVELITKYDETIGDKEYATFFEEQPIIASLTIHSSPTKRKLLVDYEYKGKSIIENVKEIDFIEKLIDAKIHCGFITIETLTPPSVVNFFETKLLNGCLNAKISIDEHGEIKNCPSMLESFGNIEQTTLQEVTKIDHFTSKWSIAKDQIEICKDCEYRYSCSDCRAYLENPNNIYSKPLKCGYDPYSAIWSDWKKKTSNNMAIKHYGIN